MSTVDKHELEETVKAVYREVADRPDAAYHFEMGRGLAERLGYPVKDLDQVPSEAVEAFAGVGYHFDLAAITAGDAVLDLGSGSGTDTFLAALHAGDNGRVVGIDMTYEQLEKSRQIRDETGFHTVTFAQGYVEQLPFEDNTFDVVISNGAINLSADKEQIFRETQRVLKPEGYLAVSDIVAEEPIPDRIKEDTDLWASCVGGAMQLITYTDIIKDAGLTMTEIRTNRQYEFRTDQARNACSKYGVKSVSLGARND